MRKILLLPARHARFHFCFLRMLNGSIHRKCGSSIWFIDAATSLCKHELSIATFYVIFLLMLLILEEIRLNNISFRCELLGRFSFPNSPGYNSFSLLLGNLSFSLWPLSRFLINFLNSFTQHIDCIAGVCSGGVVGEVQNANCNCPATRLKLQGESYEENARREAVEDLNNISRLIRTSKSGRRDGSDWGRVEVTRRVVDSNVSLSIHMTVLIECVSCRLEQSTTFSTREGQLSMWNFLSSVTLHLTGMLQRWTHLGSPVRVLVSSCYCCEM